MASQPPGPTAIAIPPALNPIPDAHQQEMLHEKAKRAKRIHKIYLLSRGNGLMTPQDKNFITRIQLQQLVAANGGTENDPEAMLAEDFYYHVYSQLIAPRAHPRQPLGHFAQTYLLQTGGRAGGRRQGGGDNHLQRMQQQVQRAVEAAKARPRNKQLTFSGSLGKISVSNSRAPKTMLSIKRDSATGKEGTAISPRVKKATLSISDRKTVLRNIETAYEILMKMEDLQRTMPPVPTSEEDASTFDAEAHMRARNRLNALNRQLWDALQILQPIVPGSTDTHPFIAFLNHNKGVKAIPRIWRHIDQDQRVTMLTMLAINLDTLNVIQKGQLQPGQAQLASSVREEIELFQRVINPLLVSYLHDAPLTIITGLLGLVLDRSTVESVVMARVGLVFLCILLSRADAVRASGQATEPQWAQWLELYNALFNRLEHFWAAIFPENINSADDVYAWQFLAAVGLNANPEQQQRLVIAVKDRVMETVQQSKTLPPDMAAKRLATVNLFMRSIGLDVDLL
ncbi:hypothetical protein KEM52_000263 [Ascosphaera acerosa]|nr:hypothetical protein KEM52_000263 [Ascosphaera acerosa]